MPLSFYLHIKSSRWCNTIFTAYKIRYCAMEHANRQITQLKYRNHILRFFFISLLFGISKKMYITSTSPLRYLLAITQWRPAIICGVCSKEKYWASPRSIQCMWREVQETATGSFPINVVIWFYRIFPVSFFSPCSRVTIEAIYSIDSHVEVCSVTHISFVCNSISIKSSYNYEARVDT